MPYLAPSNNLEASPWDERRTQTTPDVVASTIYLSQYSHVRGAEVYGVFLYVTAANTRAVEQPISIFI
jgi:hypothetical protein